MNHGSYHREAGEETKRSIIFPRVAHHLEPCLTYHREADEEIFGPSGPFRIVECLGALQEYVANVMDRHHQDPLHIMASQHELA